MASLLVGSIALILLQVISSSLEQDIALNNMNSLSSISSLLDNSILRPSKDLVLETTLFLDAFNLNKPKSHYEYYEVYQSLCKNLYLKPFIESISIYVPHENLVISSAGIKYSIQNFHDKEFIRILDENNTSLMEQWLPARTIHSTSRQNIAEGELSVVTYMYVSKIPNNTDKPPLFYVYINIYELYLHDILATINNSLSNSLMILNQSNNKITSINYKDSPLEKVGSKLLIDNSTLGYVIKEIDNKDVVFNIHQSDFSNWTYVLANHLGDFATFNNVRHQIIMVCCWIFALGFIVSLFLSRNLYSPLQRILSSVGGAPAIWKKAQNEYTIISQKISNLDSTILQMRKKVHNTVIYRLLEGTLAEPDENEICSLFPYDSSVVLLLKSFTCGNSFFSKASVFFSDFQYCYTISNHENMLYIVLNFSKSIKSPYEQIEQLLMNLRNDHSIEFNAGIGTIVDKPKDLYVSAKEAKNAYRYTFLKPSQKMFFYKDICNLKSFVASIAIDSFSTSLANNNLVKVNNFFSKTVEALKSDLYNFESIENFVLQLIGALNKEFLRNNLEKNVLSFRCLHEEFYKKQDIFQSISWLKTILTNILPMETSKDEKYEIIKQIKEYIDENYNQDISLDFFSSKYFLSTSYISTLFKSAYNIGISEYFSNIRLEKAKELLENRYLKIEEIADKIGMHNHSYFATKFKKQYGMSPQQYRIAYKAKTTAEGNITSDSNT